MLHTWRIDEVLSPDVTGIAAVALVAVLMGLACQPGEARGVSSTGPPGMFSTLTFGDEELTDSTVKPFRLEPSCTLDACQTHCRQMLHAGGRCDQDGQCQCRDLKQRGRCAAFFGFFGCGGGGGGSSPSGGNNPATPPPAPCQQCNGQGGLGMLLPFLSNNNNNNNNNNNVVVLGKSVREPPPPPPPTTTTQPGAEPMPPMSLGMSLNGNGNGNGNGGF